MQLSYDYRLNYPIKTHMKNSDQDIIDIYFLLPHFRAVLREKIDKLQINICLAAYTEHFTMIMR